MIIGIHPNIDIMLLHSISALTPQDAVCAAETEDVYILIYYIVYCLLWLCGGVTALYDE